MSSTWHLIYSGNNNMVGNEVILRKKLNIKVLAI